MKYGQMIDYYNFESNKIIIDIIMSLDFLQDIFSYYVRKSV